MPSPVSGDKGKNSSNRASAYTAQASALWYNRARSILPHTSSSIRPRIPECTCSPVMSAVRIWPIKLTCRFCLHLMARQTVPEPTGRSSQANKFNRNDYRCSIQTPNSRICSTFDCISVRDLFVSHVRQRLLCFGTARKPWILC